MEVLGLGLHSSCICVWPYVVLQVLREAWPWFTRLCMKPGPALWNLAPEGLAQPPECVCFRHSSARGAACDLEAMWLPAWHSPSTVRAAPAESPPLPGHCGNPLDPLRVNSSLRLFLVLPPPAGAGLALEFSAVSTAAESRAGEHLEVVVRGPMSGIAGCCGDFLGILTS